jgi:deoxyribonuclease V
MRPAAQDWNLTPQAAIALQIQLAARVVTRDRLGVIRRIAGLDAGFEDDGRVTRAAAVLFSYPDLLPLAGYVARQPTRFPYIPGLLSFREAPALIEALAGLPQRPDLLLCDGHGRAHPRRFGIACHLGVLLDIPSIGIGKSLLVGEHTALPERRGAHRALRHRGETVGAALRTRAGVRPVYVSCGHRVSLATALEFVLACAPRCRLPEPIRAADRLASAR